MKLKNTLLKFATYFEPTGFSHIRTAVLAATFSLLISYSYYQPLTHSLYTTIGKMSDTIDQLFENNEKLSERNEYIYGLFNTCQEKREDYLYEIDECNADLTECNNILRECNGVYNKNNKLLENCLDNLENGLDYLKKEVAD